MLTLSDDPDLFHDAWLGFTLRKPADWSFLPPAWSPMERLKNNPDSTVEWAQYAKQPFCCAMRQHESDAHAFPTLQVTARPRVGPGEAERVLEVQAKMLEQAYPGIEFLRLTSDAIVAGHRANVIEGRFKLVLTRDGVETVVGVHSRTFTVFAPRHAFTVGLSGSDDPEYADLEGFELIEASLRIGVEPKR